MEEIRPSLVNGGNPVAERRHQKEVFWQITLPFVLGIVILAVLSVLVTLGSNGAVSTWADVSLIWLIAPMLIVGLLFLIINAALLYGVVYLIRAIPPLSLKLQYYLALIGLKVRQASDAAVEPVMRTQSFSASVRALFGRNNRRSL